MHGVSTFSPGTVLAGRFEIVRFVAAGGMGAIYEARQMPLKRKIALKVIRQELSQDKQLVQRFEREAETVAQLTHSHTITLFDYGISPEGVMFIAMEWLDGLDLGAEIKRIGQLEAQRAARITAQVARSLDEAHRLGVIHRDLKPENIFLIEREGQKDFVKVLDFGIVKPTDDAKTQITRIGMVCGTPEYMSPEQARGEKVDGRSDVYALGTVLYAMLSGKPPFQSESMLQVVMQHQAASFPELGAQVPEALKGIIRRATAKQQDQRFGSAAELASALEQFALGSSALAEAISLTPTAPLGLSAASPLQTAQGPGLVKATPTQSSRPATPTAPAGMPGAGAPSFGALKVVLLVLAALLLVGAGIGIALLLSRSGSETKASPSTPPGSDRAAPSDDAVGSQAATAANSVEARAELSPTAPPVADVELAATPELVAEPELPAPVADCVEGMERGVLSEGQCCWPGQSWSNAQQSCTGWPKVCLGARLPSEKGCVDAPAELAERVSACNGGAYLACLNLVADANELELIGYYADQLHRFTEKSCENKDFVACYHMATQLIIDPDDKANFERAWQLLDASCTAGVIEACFEGYLLASEQADETRTQRFGKAYCGFEASGCEDGKPITGFDSLGSLDSLPLDLPLSIPMPMIPAIPKVSFD